MSKYENKSLEKFYITSLKGQLLLKDVVTFECTLIQDLTDVGHVLLFDHRYDSPDAVVIKFHNAMQEHHKLGASDLQSTVEEVHLPILLMFMI